MGTLLENFLNNWPKAYIRDQDLFLLYLGSDSRRHDAVKYAVAKEQLIKVKKGLYFINLPHKKQNLDPFELAQTIYGPSYISLESALFYHGWIPEAVYTTTSVTSRRKARFKTPKGFFNFAHTPIKNFYEEVIRMETLDSIFLIAQPWKALADFIYVTKKSWPSTEHLYLDLRIEPTTLRASDLSSLKKILKLYDSKYVQKALSYLLKDLK